MPIADNIKQAVDKLPDAPGVYFFKRGRSGRSGQILYIGKATSLRDRVRSYFRGDIASARSNWIAKMVELVDNVEYVATDSVLEALLLESFQIKKHQPPYNIREKDDKSYLYVGITKEDFPRLVTIRGKDLTPSPYKLKTIFGPFPHGGELREALKIIRRIFPYRDEKCQPNQGRPCFNAQIGLCPGVCSGAVTSREYGRTIRNLALFFQGRKAAVLRNLEREMKSLAKSLKFEAAEQIKRKIFALQHIHDVALIKRTSPHDFAAAASGEHHFRLEAYDVAHLSGKNTVGVMVVSHNAELVKDQYRKFKLRGSSADRADDTGNLLEILNRRLKHAEWPLPNAIVVDGGTAQANVAEKILHGHKLNIPVISVVKDSKHKARDLNGPKEIIEKYRDSIIALNAEAHRFAINYHRLLRGRML